MWQIRLIYVSEPIKRILAPEGHVHDVQVKRESPFAFCTGYAGAAELPERFAGVKALPKPLAPAALMRAVARLFAADPAPADLAQPPDS